MLFAFVVLDSVSSVLSQEISWEECIRNDLFCVKLGRKPLTQSISHCEPSWQILHVGDCHELQ